jgi:hypothetical protein
MKSSCQFEAMEGEGIGVAVRKFASSVADSCVAATVAFISVTR